MASSDALVSRRHPQSARAGGRRRSRRAAQAIAEAESVGELQRARARLLRARLGAGRVRPPRRGDAFVARARDLRAARRSRARVPGAQQPRRDRLLGRPLGRRGRALSSGRPYAASAPVGRPMPRITDCNVGEILSDQGHLDEAEAHLQRARRVLERTGDRQGVAYADVLLGRLTVRRGDYAEGSRCSRRRWRTSGGSGSTPTPSSLRPDRRSRGVRRRSVPRAGDREPASCEANDRERPLLTTHGRDRARAPRRARGRDARARALARRRRATVAPSTTSPRRSMRWRRRRRRSRRCCRERDEILGRLKIEQLSTPAIALAGSRPRPSNSTWSSTRASRGRPARRVTKRPGHVDRHQRRSGRR